MTMSSLIPKKRQDPVIKTPQALIHIKHRITLLQYKYWILLVRELREQFEKGIELENDGFRTVPMQKITDALGYMPNKKQMWDDFEALKNETIAYNVLEKDGQTAKAGTGFILEWRISNTKVAFKLPSLIENVVRGLEEPKAIFQLLNWSVFNHFSGKYEAIIYKLCKDYVGIKKTPYMTLEEFRGYMGLKEGEYKVFKDLNKVVISNSCKRINESEISDIEVEVEFEKVKRSVVGLRFYVANKKQQTIPFPELDSNPAFRFAKVHIETVTQLEYLAIRAPEEIELCIERANEYGVAQEKKGEKIKEYGALYRKAITEGWHVAQAEKKAQKVIEVVQKEKIVKAEKIKKSQEQVEADLQKQKRQAVSDAFDALPDERKDELRAMYSDTLTDMTKAYFVKEGEKGSMHKVKFLNFIEPLLNQK